MTEQRNLARKTVLAVALAPGMLAACTGSDMTMGFNGAGPVPPASIGSGGGTYGSPALTAAGSGQSLSNGYGGLPAATPPYPIEKLSGSYQAAAASQPAAVQPAVASLPAQPGSSNPISSAPLLAPPSQPQSAPAAASPARQPQPQPSVQEASIAVTSEPSAPSPARQQVATRSESTEIQFLPLVGAPNEQANLLAQALSDAAAQSGITIRAASQGRASSRLKGYFSAFDEGDQSVLVYVWDVLDPNDERIHRIQGQERFAQSPEGPWAGVDRNVLDNVAKQTLREAGSLRATAG